jgi:hypothetical protein
LYQNIQYNLLHPMYPMNRLNLWIQILQWIQWIPLGLLHPWIL